MRKLRFSGFVMAALAAVLFSYVIGLGDSPAGLKSILSDDEYEMTGLDKLTDAEQELLFVLLSVPRRDFLVETAMRQMEADRWQPVEFLTLGIRKEDTPWPEKFLVLARSGKLSRFQMPLSWENLEPGRYWAKAESHVWTLLRPDGSTDNLWPLSDD